MAFLEAELKKANAELAKLKRDMDSLVAGVITGEIGPDVQSVILNLHKNLNSDTNSSEIGEMGNRHKVYYDPRNPDSIVAAKKLAEELYAWGKQFTPPPKPKKGEKPAEE